MLTYNIFANLRYKDGNLQVCFSLTTLENELIMVLDEKLQDEKLS